MDLGEKQLFEQNQIAHVIGIVIVASMTVMTLLTFLEQVRPDMVFRLVILLVALATIMVGYRLLRTKKAYRHVVSQSAFWAYIAFIFTYQEFYVYAYIFAIAIMIMTFQDGKMLKVSATLAVIADLIFFLVFQTRYPGKLTFNGIVLQMVIVVVAAVSSSYIISTQDKHRQENLQEIRVRAEQEAAISAQIVDHARELAEDFEKAKGIADTLNGCMNSSHQSVGEIAESTRLTAEAVEHQTAKTMEIQNHIELVDGRTKEMEQLSAATKETVEQGVELIGQLKDQATEVAKINHDTEQTTKDLDQSIHEVEAITETILGISSQTNLLALNASIEAARAGDAGKGFAVVAEEIRQLSEGTKEATGQIAEIINRLTNDAQKASESMSKSASYAEKQNEMITVTGDKLLDIQKNADALNENVQEVGRAVNEVVEANTAISDSIANLSATSEEVAASTENALTLSDSSVKSLGDMNGLLAEIYGVSERMMQIVN